jgi:hypothetical protein
MSVEPDSALPKPVLGTLAQSASPAKPAVPADTILEGQRNETLYRQARSLRQRGLTAGAIAAALLVENRERCQPPLPDREVQTIARHAWTQADRLGGASAAPREPGGAERENSGPGHELTLQALRVFMNEPDEASAWLVDQLLPAGGVSELVAKPKVGKSTLARCLVAAVARGVPFLERVTHRGPVIYCGFEEKRGEVRQHFRQLGLTGEEPIYVLIGATPRDFLSRLRGSIDQIRPALVVIDPLIRLTRVKDLSEYAAVSQALEPVINLARETSTHVQLVHHGRKSAAEGGDMSLGSTAIFGSVDVGLFIRKTPRSRLISSEHRYGDGLDTERVLALDPATGWISLGSTREQDAVSAMEDVLVAWLREQPDPVDEKAILRDVEGGRAAKVIALRRLVAAGRVLRAGAGGKKDPYHYEASRGG